MEEAIRVAIVEDQRRTREGLARLIDGSPGYRIAGQYACAEDALEGLAIDDPDVVLTDLGLPGMPGIEMITAIRAMLPDTPIVVITVHGEDELVFRALCAGACGYMMKDVRPARLLEAIREVHEGGAPMSPDVARRVVSMFQKLAPKQEAPVLTAREMDVLRLLAAGCSYKGCANKLSVSLDTIRFHVRKIYERLHVHSKSEAVVKALKSGWIG